MVKGPEGTAYEEQLRMLVWFSFWRRGDPLAARRVLTVGSAEGVLTSFLWWWDARGLLEDTSEEVSRGY